MMPPFSDNEDLEVCMFTRRPVCAGAALAACVALLAAVPAQAAGSTCGRNDAVSVAGARFRCGNKPFRFVGANSRELLYLWGAVFNLKGDPVASARLLYDQLRTADAMGIGVMRVYLPREERAFVTASEYHDDLSRKLRYLLDFATEAGPFPAPGPDDYRGWRLDAAGGLLPPPAPTMKFLVVLSDSIYACSRYSALFNMVLQPDVADPLLPSYGPQHPAQAYQPNATGATCPAPPEPDGDPSDLNFMRPEWYRRAGQPRNYREYYLPLVRAVAGDFAGDPRIFGFELGNEMFAANAADMKAFAEDVACAVKGTHCASQLDRRASARDRTRLLGAGFITTGHASGCASDATCISSAQTALYGGGSALDFASIHQYDNLTTEGQDRDYAYLGGRVPYVVGELGYTYADASRAVRVHAGLERIYDASGANGVLPWAFYAGRDPHGSGYVIHPAGLDQLKPDWGDLFAEYRCRALRLDHQNAGRTGLDIALGYLDWSNLTRAGATDVQVGEQVRFHFHVCNVGTQAATLGQGVSLFLTNNTPTPPPLVPIGTGVYVAGTLEPGQVITIDSDWTVVAPSTLNPNITLDNAVVVGLADDINRYPSEITETNNGYSIDFPILPCPGSPLSQSGVCCLPVSVVNPSFEEPVISPPWARFNSIPGWNGPIDIHRVPDLPASDGFQVADLNQNSTGYVGQVISTIPGGAYAVRWAQGVNYHCIGSAALSLDIDGISVGSFSSVTTPAYKQATFTAAGTSTELRFRSLTGGCGAATVDDVSVSCQ